MPIFQLFYFCFFSKFICRNSLNNIDVNAKLILYLVNIFSLLLFFSLFWKHYLFRYQLQWIKFGNRVFYILTDFFPALFFFFPITIFYQLLYFTNYSNLSVTEKSSILSFTMIVYLSISPWTLSNFFYIYIYIFSLCYWMHTYNFIMQRIHVP